MWAKNIKNTQKWFFPPFVTQNFFLKNRTLSLSYLYGALISCKKLEKTNERSLRYLKTDTRTHARTTEAITKDPFR